MKDFDRIPSTSGYIKKNKRSLGPICRGNCEKLKGTKCSIFAEDQRLKIFDEFWSNNYKMKDRHDYLNKLIDNLPSENGMPIYSYHLMLDNKRIHVCREMFLSTLGISIKMLKFPKENSKNAKMNSQSNIPNSSSESDIYIQSVLNYDSCSDIKSISAKKKTSTREMGVQCDLLRELWTDYTYQSKKRFSFFENFLNTVSLSDDKYKKSNQNIFDSNKLMPEFLFPKSSSDNLHSDSYADNKSSSAIESIPDTFDYQDDVDTIIETGHESESNSEAEDYYQPKTNSKKKLSNYIKLLDGFKCQFCKKIFRLKSAILKHLNLHLCHKRPANDSFSIMKKRNYKNFLKTKKTSNFKEKFSGSVNIQSQQRQTKRKFNTKTCPVCSKKFMTEQSALDHLNTHTKEAYYTCSCGAKFSEHKKFIWHLSKYLCSTNTSISPVSCPSQTETDCYKHELAPPETFYCKICDIDFSESKCEKHFSSENHLQNENVWIRKYDIRKYTCLECKMDFELLLELIRHRVRKHRKRISFLFFERLENFNLKYCYICDKSFIKRINYYDHMNMHKKIYAYACSCGKKFQFYNSLIYHSQKRGCPVKGRILPNYFPKLYSTRSMNILSSVNNSTEEENENKSSNSMEPKRIIDITGKISKIEEISKENIFNKVENKIPHTNLIKNENLNRQPPVIYYPQLFNSDCVLDQSQILSVPGNQSNHLIPPQIMPGTVFVYEAISQPNVYQVPQILNLSDIGQAIQMPIHSSNNTSESLNNQQSTIDFDPEFNKMIKFKNFSNIEKNLIINSEEIAGVEKDVNPQKQIFDSKEKICGFPTTSNTLNELESNDNYEKEDSNDSVNKEIQIDQISVDQIEPDESDVIDERNVSKVSSQNRRSKTFYCELCRLNYASSCALEHFYDINHRKLEDEWRKTFNIHRITCPLCPLTTFDKFFGLICHQYKVHRIKVDKLFFKKYKESFEKLNKK